jgi:hypothetical protein
MQHGAENSDRGWRPDFAMRSQADSVTELVTASPLQRQALVVVLQRLRRLSQRYNCATTLRYTFLIVSDRMIWMWSSFLS